MMKRAESHQFPYRALALIGAGLATLYGIALADRVGIAPRLAFPKVIGHVVADIEAQVGVTAGPFLNGDENPAPVDATVVVTSTGMLTDLFDRVGYALDDVRATGEVPRLFLASLPGDLPDLLLPAERKRIFIKATLPLVLNANEAINRDRRRVQTLRAEAENGVDLAVADVAWLEELARTYRLDFFNFDELLVRLDIVPPSLAIAQAATESGWGTSRFARHGNALFGQKTFGGDAGLVPLRSDGPDGHRVRAFDDLLDAVKSYAFNLNSHQAYAEFRARRAKLRRTGRPLTGSQLAEPLHRYSELGTDYVRFLGMLIRTNDLEAFDDARLGTASFLANANFSGI